MDEVTREMVDTGGRDPCPGGEEGAEEAAGEELAEMHAADEAMEEVTAVEGVNSRRKSEQKKQPLFSLVPHNEDRVQEEDSSPNT